MVQQKVVFLLYDTKIKFFPIMWMAILLMIPTLIRAQHVPHAIVEDVNRYVFELDGFVSSLNLEVYPFGLLGVLSVRKNLQIDMDGIGFSKNGRSFTRAMCY